MTNNIQRSQKNKGNSTAAPPKTKTQPKAKPATKQAAKDINHNLEDEISRLKAQVADETNARKEAEAARAEAEKARNDAEAAKREAEQKAKAKERDTPIIPKPKAEEMSEGTDRLRQAMGLIDDKATYLTIQSTIQDLVHQVRLDVRLEYLHQPAKALGDLFKLARHLQPHLVRFQNDWATAELVKQYLSNRHKSELQKRKAVQADEGHAKRLHIEELMNDGKPEE